MRPIVVPLVISATLAKFIGTSGTLKIIAPLPERELTETPLIFVASTLA